MKVFFADPVLKVCSTPRTDRMARNASDSQPRRTKGPHSGGDWSYLVARGATGRTRVLPQLLQQRLCILQVPRVEAFREPVVDGLEEVASLGALVLALPEGGEGGGGDGRPPHRNPRGGLMITRSYYIILRI